MFCCPRCSHLSAILNNIVEPESGVTMLFNIVDSCECEKTWFNPVFIIYSPIILRNQAAAFLPQLVSSSVILNLSFELIAYLSYASKTGFRFFLL
jgi:hypothetical protein